MQASSIQTMRSHLADALRPIRAMRWAYLPLLMVYFAYGALGLIDVSRDMWIKERLTMSAAELAGLGVWLSLPWTMKMVFGQLVDCFPIWMTILSLTVIRKFISAVGVATRRK